MADPYGGFQRVRNQHGSSTSSSSVELASSGEGDEVVEDTIFVAVGKEVKESKYTLIWALQNSKGKKICLIHVHEPPQTIRILGGNFPISKAAPEEARAHLVKARQDMLEVLDKYVGICSRAGVQAGKIYIERDSVKKGIVELVSQHRIGKLAMGAAADNKFSRKMIEPRSEKAHYVRIEAPTFCHIWFICKGHLVYTRNGIKKPSPVDEVRDLSSSFQSLSLPENNQSNLELHGHYGSYGKSAPKNVSLNDEIAGCSSPGSKVGAEESLDEFDLLSISQSPALSPFYEGANSSSPFSDTGTAATGELDLSFLNLPSTSGKHQSLSPPSVLGKNASYEVFDQLEQALTEAENSMREAFGESRRRRIAEKYALNAIRRAKEAETAYSMEWRQRQDIAEELAMVKEEQQHIKNQRDKVYEELQNALVQKSLLEEQMKQSKLQVKELEEKMISAVQLLQQYKEEREELQIERDDALREAEELRKQLELQPFHSNTPQNFSTFSLQEIEEATNYLDSSLKIGEGGYGIIYKGFLRHTEVAVKMPHSDSMQGPEEFYQEVDVLSKLRHPNIITLIGVCPESLALVYEYLPNRSLEDRLSCKDNAPPLSWQVRLQIAAELCSTLIFLHSNKPHSIIHGDLKPANILLDGNLRCKLSDFGISCAVSSNGIGTESTARFYATGHPKGTFAYVDPEFLSTGELSTKADVYSYGIILLRLLTGKPAKGITMEVQYALDKENLDSILDPLAGDWPFVQAHQLACLALRCCDRNRVNRPDLVSEVWRILEAMTASCGILSSLRSGDDDDDGNLVPSYFSCPIFQEIMRDPHVAADGFTYEAEALRGWLDNGHDTSPMTNLKLAHRNLIPNHALRSAIQEWMQLRQR